MGVKISGKRLDMSNGLLERKGQRVMVEQLRNVCGNEELIGYMKEWRLAGWAWVAVRVNHTVKIPN